MTDKKIIAVVGATGRQGGALVRAILDDPDGPFAARALTRNPDSGRAKEFAARGAEVVRADLDDESSLRVAFDGAFGAFVVTNYWERRTDEEWTQRNAAGVELEQAANAAGAAKATGLRHVVWSTLEDTRPHFRHLGSDAPDVDGDYKVPHFDAKGEANSFFTGLGVPTTFLETSFFYEMMLTGYRPRRDAGGQLVLTLPLGEGVVAMVGTEDIGRTAYSIFQAGQRFVGRTIGLAGDQASGEKMAAIFTTVLGEKVTYRPTTPDQERRSGNPFAEETANMYRFYLESSDAYLSHRDPDRSRVLNPRLQSFQEWLVAHRAEAMSVV